MDQDLKQYLDFKFLEINGNVIELNGNVDELKRKVAELDSKFPTKQDLERVETTLLTEFHKWASPAEARARTHTATLRAIDLEMESITERVEKLENRQ
jgi:polyhydroxyalkanoate synthesis regulator phasin